MIAQDAAARDAADAPDAPRADIQEEILVAEVEPGRDVFTECALRAIVGQADWTEQRNRWRGHGGSALRASST